jgi:integrase/recombinase XerC
LSPVIRREDSELTVLSRGLTFNLALALPGRASSYHTQRAYFRWIDEYLADVAGLARTEGLTRLERMSNLPVSTLQASLSAAQLRAWLGVKASQGHGRQGLGQARAAVTTLASLMAESGLLDDGTAAAMSGVRLPRAGEGQRTGRWLSIAELRLLMQASRQIATSENQMLRNDVVMTTLCTMGLRREELSNARWNDFSMQNQRAVMRVRGKGKKTALIDVPAPVVASLERWRRAVLAAGLSVEGPAPVVTRLWRGGRIGRTALTPEAIWMIIHEAAHAAGLGDVAPHDLRRSVAGALQQNGVSIDKISRLLRHSNVGVTERYLSRLPQPNEGALLMSDMLEMDGLEADEDE